MSDINLKFLTGKPDDDWERKQSHIPAIGAIVMRPDMIARPHQLGNERLYRVMDHVWPSGTLDDYVVLRVSEIVDAPAEPEPETEAENEN